LSRRTVEVWLSFGKGQSKITFTLAQKTLLGKLLR
jgi:hypothetical protein